MIYKLIKKQNVLTVCQVAFFLYLSIPFQHLPYLAPSCQKPSPGICPLLAARLQWRARTLMIPWHRATPAVQRYTSCATKFRRLSSKIPDQTLRWMVDSREILTYEIFGIVMVSNFQPGLLIHVTFELKVRTSWRSWRP